MDAVDRKPLLRVRGLGKSYGAIEALSNVDLDVFAGEVLALCGDNGAGKSTLIKALSGSNPADTGSVEFAGQEVKINSPHDATALGISTVYQDLALCNNLDIVGNLFLGREKSRAPFVGHLRRLQTPQMHSIAEKTLRGLGMRLPELTTPISELSGGQRQCVAVGRAVLWGSRLVMLDEPTAALGVEQTRQVLDMVERLAAQGMGVVVISHSLPDVFKVADRIAVLRLGRMIGVFDKRDTSPEQIVSGITGGSVRRTIN